MCNLQTVVCELFLKSFSFDSVELVSGITKTVLLVTDIDTKLNGPVDTSVCPTVYITLISTVSGLDSVCESLINVVPCCDKFVRYSILEFSICFQ